MAYWLIKTDPETYSWDDFKKDGETSWDGIRNYAARNHMKNMKKGDKLLVYHSGGESAVVGTATVTKEFYQDPTTKEDAWISVGVRSDKALKNPVTLSGIKKHNKLQDMILLKISRLSVLPVTKDEYETIIKMSDI